jgi:NAD(P)-dependent dehydrogenase (short-subunit alcohol dehydrogenase family)
MFRRCGDNRGQIINISSIGVLSNAPRFSAYVTPKSALDSFAACAASEFVDKRISTTCRLLAQRMALRDNARDDVLRAWKDPRPRSEGDDGSLIRLRLLKPSTGAAAVLAVSRIRGEDDENRIAVIGGDGLCSTGRVQFNRQAGTISV